MRNNSGITLVALVVIIVLLIIFTSAAIYTSVNSYKLIDLQKYKAQMQAIQSAVDEFYEEFESMYDKHERELKEIVVNDPEDTSKTINLINNKQDFMKYYIKYIDCLNKNSIAENKEITSFITEVNSGNHTNTIKNYYEKTPSNNDWWENIAQSKFGISTGEDTIKKQYYYLSKAEVQSLLGVKNIDISDNFIINFEKRYVFSENFIEVDYEGRPEDGELKKVYCLYQLNEEEKVIEFKAENTGGMLEIAIVEKTLNYQTIRIKLIGQESTIKKVYFYQEGYTEPLLVEEDKEHVQEVTGLETNEVFVKIKKDGEYIFGAEDLLGGVYANGTSIKITLHQPPVLEDNLIPFVATNIKEDVSTKITYTGIVYPQLDSDDINNWYDYSKLKYATAVISTDNYEEIQKGKTFNIDQYKNNSGGEKSHIVKVWIPKNLYAEINEKVKFKYIKSSNFINKSGIWVGAKWDDTNLQWVPDMNYNPYNSSLEFNFDGTKIGNNDTTVKDSSMHANTFEGSGYTLKPEENCITFDGTGGIKTNEKIQFGNEFTIEVVLKPENNPGSDRI